MEYHPQAAPPTPQSSSPSERKQDLPDISHKGRTGSANVLPQRCSPSGKLIRKMGLLVEARGCVLRE